jgi:6,7-dimethyl-8-ribityllumazine synthase
MENLAGTLNASELKVGVVVSRFNSTVTEKLLAAARETFLRCGGREENLSVAHVPGSFEIPITAKRMIETRQLDAVVCLGCLIRGETPHFDCLASEVTRGLGSLALQSTVPVAYGIITADTVEQAINRSGVKHGNKGTEAMVAGIEMASLFQRMS